MASREEEFDRRIQHRSIDHEVVSRSEEGGANRHALGRRRLYHTRIFSILSENELRRLANDVVLKDGKEELQVEEESRNALPERLCDDIQTRGVFAHFDEAGEELENVAIWKLHVFDPLERGIVRRDLGKRIRNRAPRKEIGSRLHEGLADLFLLVRSNQTG